MAQSVGHTYTLLIFFLNSNEEIVFETQNQRSFFLLNSLLSCVLCVILQFIHISHLSKSLSSTVSLHGPGGARIAFSESALMRDVVLFDMPVSLLALSL